MAVIIKTQGKVFVAESIQEVDFILDHFAPWKSIKS
jgi:hypothetical protein